VQPFAIVEEHENSPCAAFFQGRMQQHTFFFDGVSPCSKHKVKSTVPLASPPLYNSVWMSSLKGLVGFFLLTTGE
jgi:hypothetical protein